MKKQIIKLMFPFVKNKLKKCECCDKKNIEKGVHLQCNHQLCIDCLNNNVINKTFGEYIDMLSIKKEKLILTLADTEENKMVFVKNKLGFINCPKCMAKYSIFSPIYRHFGIPKLIAKIITFFEDYDNKSTYNYHICTNLDIIHLLNIDDQKKLLKEFSYHKEEEYINDELITTYDYVNSLFNTETDVVHAITYIDFENGTKNIEFVDCDKCQVCKNNTSIISDNDSIDTNDVIIIKHCTLDEFVKFAYC